MGIREKRDGLRHDYYKKTDALKEAIIDDARTNPIKFKLKSRINALLRRHKFHITKGPLEKKITTTGGKFVTGHIKRDGHLNTTGFCRVAGTIARGGKLNTTLGAYVETSVYGTLETTGPVFIGGNVGQEAYISSTGGGIIAGDCYGTIKTTGTMVVMGEMHGRVLGGNVIRPDQDSFKYANKSIKEDFNIASKAIFLKPQNLIHFDKKTDAYNAALGTLKFASPLATVIGKMNAQHDTKNKIAGTTTGEKIDIEDHPFDMSDGEMKLRINHAVSDNGSVHDILMLASRSMTASADLVNQLRQVSADKYMSCHAAEKTEIVETARQHLEDVQGVTKRTMFERFVRQLGLTLGVIKPITIDGIQEKSTSLLARVEEAAKGKINDLKDLREPFMRAADTLERYDGHIAEKRKELSDEIATESQRLADLDETVDMRDRIALAETQTKLDALNDISRIILTARVASYSASKALELAMSGERTRLTTAIQISQNTMPLLFNALMLAEQTADARKHVEIRDINGEIISSSLKGLKELDQLSATFDELAEIETQIEQGVEHATDQKVIEKQAAPMMIEDMRGQFEVLSLAMGEPEALEPLLIEGGEILDAEDPRPASQHLKLVKFA